MVTVAPDMAAPLASDILPNIRPVEVCENSGRHKRDAEISTAEIQTAFVAELMDESSSEARIRDIAKLCGDSVYGAFV